MTEFNNAGIAVELCWRDAGWYPCKGSWPNTGTWELDPQRYPRGWRPFSDWLHQQGRKFIVWFEPERVGDPEMPNQGHTYGISSWIPYYGSGCYLTDPYSARSYIMPCSGYAGTDVATKRAYDECRQVAPFMLGAFYPLTPYSLQPGDWIAWQFDRPDPDGGVVPAQLPPVAT